MKENIETVAVVGMGALGMLFADLIQERLGPESVCFVMDEERKKRHENDRFIINRRETDFIRKTPEDVTEPDLILVATKSTGLREAAETVKAILGPETTVISLLNGISSEEILAEYIPEEQILDCVAIGMDALREGTTLIYHTPGKLQFGKTDRRKQEATDRLFRFLEKAGVPFEPVEDIRHAMWCKFMLNCGINQICAVYGTSYNEAVLPGDPREDMMAAMREVMDLSDEAGIFLTDGDFERTIRILIDLDSDGYPSMRQDVLAKRKTEVELFAGAVIDLAKQYQMPVPVNKRLYREIRAMEDSWEKED